MNYEEDADVCGVDVFVGHGSAGRDGAAYRGSDVGLRFHDRWGLQYHGHEELFAAI
jgi:hypothetical protein